MEKRKCPARGVQPVGCEIGCRPCSITCGWGGAGAFSDGKLTLSPEVGGWLTEYVGRAGLEELIAYVIVSGLNTAPPSTIHGTDRDKVEEIRQHALQVGLRLVDAPIRHMGTDRCPQVLQAMRDDLNGKVDVATRTTVQKTARSEGQGGRRRAEGRAGHQGKGRHRRARTRGRRLDGAKQAHDLGLNMTNNAVDIGVRSKCRRSSWSR